jgi:beta-lactam-binding protein with PASTA domain
VHVISPDTIVDGRYRALRRLGSGGMAEVWMAEDEVLGRRVALKLLGGRFVDDPEFRERFRREAQAAAALTHPNIVGIFDRAEWNGIPYIAMELVDGSTLKDLVRERGPLPPTVAVEFIEQILRALGYAHKRGLVHRDVKPQNVIIDPDGVAKVADFGIARAGNSEMTETGTILGTVQYVSPEQAQGLPTDRRSDLYSAGVVLYELLTGRVPFDGEASVSVALKHVTEPPVPPGQLRPGIPPALDAVVMRALAKDPARRFQTAEEFIAALEAARRGPPRVVVPPEPIPEPSGPRWWVWALALLALAAIAVGAYALLNGERVTVPNVVGMQADEALERLQSRGLEVNPVGEVSDDVPRNEVIGQDPAAGTEVREGSTITLRISTGRGEAIVPAVVGQPRDDAEQTVKEAGFRVRVREAFSDDVPEGDVISVSPPPGEPLQRGRTVTLVVSKGPEGVVVPSLVGLKREEAERQLADTGLTAEVTERETTQPPGTVMAQEPASGTRVNKGTAVRLTVAKARPQVPDVTTGNPTAEEAQAALEQAGYQVQRRERSGDPALAGRVIDQSPDPGTPRSTGATVTIIVVAAPADTEPTPTPTETP